MSAPDPKLALSAIETEQLRDIRSRLNRVPKGSLGDKSVGPLSRGFFDVCARTIADVPALAGLRGQIADLLALKAADPAAYRKAFDAGQLQAVVTRRLELGGRERTNEEA